MAKRTAKEKVDHLIQYVEQNLGTLDDFQAYANACFHAIHLPQPTYLKDGREIFVDDESREELSGTKLESQQEHLAMSWLHSARPFQSLERLNLSHFSAEVISNRLDELSCMEFHRKCSSDPSMAKAFSRLISIDRFGRKYKSLTSAPSQDFFKSIFYGALSVVLFRLFTKYENPPEESLKQRNKDFDDLIRLLDDALERINLNKGDLDPDPIIFRSKMEEKLLPLDQDITTRPNSYIQSYINVLRARQADLNKYKHNKRHDLERDFVWMLLSELRSPLVLDEEADLIDPIIYEKSLSQGKLVVESLGVLLNEEGIEPKTIDAVIDAISKSFAESKVVDINLNIRPF